MFVCSPHLPFKRNALLFELLHVTIYMPTFTRRIATKIKQMAERFTAERKRKMKEIEHIELRHKRTLDLEDFTPERLAKMQQSSVLVIGAGGLGSAVLPLLAAQELHSIHLVDCDTVDVSNLPRQLLYTSQELGQDKAALAAHRLQKLNERGEMRYTSRRVDAEWLATYNTPLDLVIDCTDNFATRLLLDQFCADRSIALVWGAVEGYTGQLSLFHGKAGCSLRDVFNDIPHERPLNRGIFPPLVQQIGSMMAGVALRWLAFGESELDGKFLQLDARTFITQIFAL